MDNYSRIERTSKGGTKYLDDQKRLHRTDGPALIRSDGGELWCLCGEIHRTDGPAWITPSECLWFLESTELSFEDWCSKLNKSPVEITELVLKYDIQGRAP